MHEAAYNRMAEALDSLHKPGCPQTPDAIADCTCGYNVLDVGSMDLNGTYRPLIERWGWKYTGLDIAAGPNVDVVATSPLWDKPLAEYGGCFARQYPTLFDVVISGSTLEHVKNPFSFIFSCGNAMMPGGWLIIVTHHNWPEHRHPVDCWRVFPDGMRALFEGAGLAEVLIEMYDDHDIIGIARNLYRDV